jgi:hypothetical protein
MEVHFHRARAHWNRGFTALCRDLWVPAMADYAVRTRVVVLVRSQIGVMRGGR